MTEESCKVLIVDDNEEYRYALELIVRSLGHESIHAADGFEALKATLENVPDLILLDINMPNMDGIIALQKIRRNPKLRSVPIIMISTLLENETVLECLEAGADDYIVKPFDKAILKARISNNLIRRIYQKKEKEILEKTLIGSIHILTEILETLDSKVFSRIARIKKHIKYITEELDLDEDKWVMDMATHFYMIGCIHLPRDFVLKSITGRMLNWDEKKIFEQHVLHGYKILSKIPRLERVADVVRLSFKNYDGSGSPEDIKVSGEAIPVESKILRAAWEYEMISIRNDSPEATIASIKTLSGKVDPNLLPYLEKLYYLEQTGDVIEVSLPSLSVGMILMEDIYTKNAVKVAGMWQEVTESLLDRILSIAITFGLKEPFKIIFPKSNVKQKD
ncbi:MAG TPA: response regulator [Leptospiraceae bacterium]|nr:response regulator [Leptospiraceae bacterium]HMW06613.1 response regulator [Leptospiraceae bacterium]HMX32041.1 response regulator [Leptospiraceae bacterium]HMY31196.1 response regulator [Leptospiraceae bacterium]HMZ63317.1 response regulator [Leptospiraceae bacterium]